MSTPEPPPGAEPAAALSRIFRAPRWLRDLGNTAWLSVGVSLAVVGAIALLALTQTIVGPLIAATVVAAVTAPVVRRLVRAGAPRALATAIVLVLLIAIALGIVLAVVAGITSQAAALGGHLGDAQDTLTGWAADLGIDDGASAQAGEDAAQAASAVVPSLLHGVGGALKALSGLAFFLSLTVLSLFFLLKDGPRIRGWLEAHTGLPRPIAHGIGRRVLGSLRGYFVGVTIVAAFNAVVVGAAALIIGIPMVGTIVVVTFVGAYIPYLGAWGAGAFVVLVALGGAGTTEALAMIVVQLLANGILQQMIQPIAYGAALGIHPLAVLVVTIAGGALFGAVGLILAAPLTSAATRIAADLRAPPPAPA